MHEAISYESAQTMNQMETVSTAPALAPKPSDPSSICPTQVPPSVAADAQTPPPGSEGATILDGSALQQELRALQGLFDTVAVRLTALESLAESTIKQLGFVPPQVRALGSKIESVAASLSDSRYRGLLLNVLLVFDLVDQPLRVDPSAHGYRLEGEHRRNYEVLRTQLRQILEANGLFEISTEGAFNPEWQRALETVATDNPANAGMVCRVLRPGFRAANSVLRYAEVSVWSAVSKPLFAQASAKDSTELAGGRAAAESSQQTLVPSSAQAEEKPDKPLVALTVEQTETKI
jgi:hypothetical protein